MDKVDVEALERAWEILFTRAQLGDDGAGIAQAAIGDFLDALPAPPASDGMPGPALELPHDDRPVWMRAAWEHRDGDPLQA